MMKNSILFCTGIFPPDIGGPATYVLKMAEKMSSDGIRVSVITYAADSKKTNCAFPVFNIRKSFFALNYLRYSLAVIREARKHDIIYLQGSFSEGIPTVLANMFLRKKAIIRIGGIFSWELATNLKKTKDLPEDFFRNKQSFFCEVLKKIDRFVISHCDKILANSQYMKKLLILNGINPEKITVIYNSFDPAVPIETSKELLKKKYNAQNKIVLLSHGRFVPWKNFDKLLLFFKELPEKYFLIIAGEGPEKGNLEQIIKEENLEKRVCLLPKQSKNDLAELNNFADIFILLSSYEGLSNALIETRQLNRKIIASDIEPNIEALAQYGSARIVPINKESFVEAVLELDKLEASRDICMENMFDFDIIYKKTINALCM